MADVVKSFESTRGEVSGKFKVGLVEVMRSGYGVEDVVCSSLGEVITTASRRCMDQ